MRELRLLYSLKRALARKCDRLVRIFLFILQCLTLSHYQINAGVVGGSVNRLLWHPKINQIVVGCGGIHKIVVHV